MPAPIVTAFFIIVKPLKGYTVSAPAFLYPGWPSAVKPKRFPPKSLFNIHHYYTKSIKYFFFIINLYSDLGGLSFYEDSSGKYVVGADSVPKKLGSVPIKGHLKAGRTRGGAGVGEITFYDIPKGTSIKISNLSLPYGPNNTINFYVKVNGNSILTTNGSYNITSDINTIIIYMYVYLSEEGSGGYGNCDYEIAFW